jgi:regulatory protein
MGFHSSPKFDCEEALYDYAVAALARRMRSIAELKRRLRQHVQAETAYGQTLVEVVIRKLKDQGYLNDARYAAAYSCFRRDKEKFGPRRVMNDLKRKGVHGEIIDKAVASAYDELSEEQQARAFVQRKRLVKPKNQKQAARIFRQLVRAGFDRQTIFSILKKWDVDEEMLDSLQTEIL